MIYLLQYLQILYNMYAIESIHLLQYVEKDRNCSPLPSLVK